LAKAYFFEILLTVLYNFIPGRPDKHIQ